MHITHFLNCRPFNLPKVLMQTGKSQAPQWIRRERIPSNSQEVSVAGRCRFLHQPQQTTTRKRLQRKTHLAIVVWTCQVRNSYPDRNMLYTHTSDHHNASDSWVSFLFLAEVLESFMATREAMQVQQNVTVYESFGTSTLPSSMESPVSPERELDPKQQRESEESLPFPAACHLVVSRCLFLLLGVRSAWVEPSEKENNQGLNTGAR